MSKSVQGSRRAIIDNRRDNVVDPARIASSKVAKQFRYPNLGVLQATFVLVTTDPCFGGLMSSLWAYKVQKCCRHVDAEDSWLLLEGLDWSRKDNAFGMAENICPFNQSRKSERYFEMEAKTKPENGSKSGSSPKRWGRSGKAPKTRTERTEVAVTECSFRF